ncbi:MAG: DUF4388 domain-containing protein [Chloroflexota bacterium]
MSSSYQRNPSLVGSDRRIIDDEYDLRGKLGAFTISDLFQMFSFLEKSGTLSMIQGWNTRTITFERGRITYVAAGSRLPNISDLLVRNGLVEPAYVERLRKSAKDDMEIVRALLDAGRVSQPDIQRCQDQLLEISIYTLFLWRNCNFTFKAGELVHEGGVGVETPDSMHLIIEGSRRVDEWIEISPVVPSQFMIFRKRREQPDDPPPEEYRDVFDTVDGHRDVGAIARAIGTTQFGASKALYELSMGKYVEAIPPSRDRVIQLFNQAVESIYLKLIMFDYSRSALEFENQLNRFALENGLKVRMSAGKILISDSNTPKSVTELVDLYKLFIGINNNKFSKEFDPVVAQGLMEGLYRHTDHETRQMMRMYEFVEIEGLLLLDQMGDLTHQSQN